MPDKSITKVNSANAPKGRFGQKYLASGIRISMRLWESEQPDEAKREYEMAGFVIEGKAELHPWCARLPMPGRWTSQAAGMLTLRRKCEPAPV